MSKHKCTHTSSSVLTYSGYEFGRSVHANVQLHDFLASLFSMHRSILGHAPLGFFIFDASIHFGPRTKCTLMTGQEFFFMVNGEKSKDQEQRVFDIACTWRDMEYCVHATSTKFWGHDLGKHGQDFRITPYINTQYT